MNLARRSITLHEMPTGGWVWLEHDKRYKNLTVAVRSVNRDSKRIAENVGGVITVITYEPCSLAGRAAVKVVTGE